MKKNTHATIALFLLLFLLSNITNAQPGENRLKALVKTVSFLADDKLEGRRAGTKGE